MDTAMVEDASNAAADDALAVGPAIADRIASSISLGLLSVGERLPAEVELAQQLGVAVATLRKGLAVLRERELVVTHRGRSGGTFVVKAPFPTPDEAQQRLDDVTIVELRDLRDERIAIGTAVARLASERAWPGSLDRLHDLALRMAQATEPSAAASADSRFHIELAVLSQSTRLFRAEMRLQSETSPYLWVGAELPSLAQTTHDAHLAIVDAVRRGDADAAAATMREHLEHDIRRVIEAKLAADRAAT